MPATPTAETPEHLRNAGNTEPPIPGHYYVPIPRTPHRCPICEGKGQVCGGFYDSLPGCPPVSTTMAEQCRACQGSGIIYT